jgi:hypothetical protein
MLQWFSNLRPGRYFAFALLYGVLTLGFIFGIDMMWHSGARWEWFWGRLARAFVESCGISLFAAYLYHLQDKRRRQVQYLNHHIRNALSLISMADHLPPNSEQRKTAVRGASRRICSVLEQMSRDEDVSIHGQDPERYTNAA